MRLYWLFTFFVLLLCLKQNIAFPSFIIESLSKDGVGSNGNVTESVMIEHLQEGTGNMTSFLNLEKKVNGTVQNIDDVTEVDDSTISEGVPNEGDVDKSGDYFKGYFIQTAKSTLNKSVENEISKATKEETAAGGIEYNSTELNHKINGNNHKYIHIPHGNAKNIKFETGPEVSEKFQQIVRNPINLAEISERKGTTYEENISDYSNRKYDFSSIFPEFDDKDTFFKYKKILPRSMKPTKNVMITSQELGDIVTFCDHKVEHENVNNPQCQCGEIDESSHNADSNKEDILDFGSSLEVDENEFVIESNELFNYDDMPKSIEQELHRAEKSKNNFEQKNENKHTTQKKEHETKDFKENELFPHRLFLQSQGESIDYDETLSSKKFNLSSCNGSNTKTVCTCYRIGGRKSQNGCTHSTDQRDVFIFDQDGNVENGTQNIESPLVLSQLLRNICGINTDLRTENILSTQNSGKRPLLITSGNINPAVLSLLRILGARQGGSSGNIVGNQIPRKTLSQNIIIENAASRNSNNLGVEVNQQSGNMVPVLLMSPSLVDFQTDSQNSNFANILVNQNNEGVGTLTIPPPNRNTIIGAVVTGQIGNSVAIQSAAQNSMNANILLAQNNGGVSNPIRAVPQSVITVGTVVTGPQNSNNANILVAQSNRGLETPIPAVPQNGNNLSPVVIVPAIDSVAIQSASQNANNANILVNQNNGGVGNTFSFPQIGNNLEEVILGQTGNSLTLQSSSQNPNNANILVNQNNGGIVNPLPSFQIENNLGAVVTGRTGNSVAIQSAPQNSNNANVLLNQNNGGIGNPLPSPQTVNDVATIVTGQTGNSVAIQSTSQNSNNANILVNQNNGGIVNSLPSPQTFNNVATIVTGQTGNSVAIQSASQNSNNANVLVNQNNGGIVNSLPSPQTVNNVATIVTGQTGNSVAIQSASQNSNNANILVNQNNGGIVNPLPSPQIDNNLGSVVTGQTRNLVAFQGASQNLNTANILLNQNNGVIGNPLSSLQNGNTLGAFVAGQGENSVVIQSDSQNSNNANILASQNNGAISSFSVPLPGNNVGTAIVTEQTNSIASQSVLQNTNNANIVVNQNNGEIVNLLTGPQNIDNGNGLVSPNSGTRRFLPTTLIGNNNNATVVTQQTGNLLAVQTNSQNSNVANIVLSQNAETGNTLLPKSFDVGISVTQEGRNLGAAKNRAQIFNNANLLTSVPQNVGSGGLPQQEGNVLSGGISSQSNNNVGFFSTNLLPYSEGRQISQQFGDAFPIQDSLNGGLVSNVQSNNLFSLGVNSPDLNSGDALPNQLGRNSISLQFPTTAELLQSIGNGNRRTDLLRSVSDQRYNQDLLNYQHIGSNLGQTNLLPNGLIAISSSGNPEFTILPDAFPPNVNKCDCNSKLPSNLAAKDNIIIVVPTSDEQVYTKVLSSVTGSHEQPFSKPHSEHIQFATSPHSYSYTNPIIYHSKPSPLSYNTDYPTRLTNKFDKGSIEAEKEFFERVPETNYKSNPCCLGLPIDVRDKSLNHFDTLPRVNPQSYNIHKVGTLPDWHNHQPQSFGIGKKPKLYKYEPKIMN